MGIVRRNGSRGPRFEIKCSRFPTSEFAVESGNGFRNRRLLERGGTEVPRRGDVAMDQATSAVLDDHEYVEQADYGSGDDHEITSDDSLRV